MSHDDFAVEPIEGLPERPPEGEQILWQGRPDTLALAREALNLNWIIGYFAILAAWRFISVVDLLPIGQAIGATVPVAVLGLVVCALLYAIALIQARATMYTITTSRIAMRIGAALTLTINLPYRELGNAALDLRKNGTGTIALDTTGQTKISYLVLWPHARPWRFGSTQPALRCIPDAENVARILADAAEARITTPQITRVAPGGAVAAE
ncbi:photosynthetic complex putative assembly protein PuhB [uncultured Tateyamaria sp.]|uniref:photosynthetic complex putative assembly protein PuhB n=1 Tax=uncultured Tateyamaria sp. TaxID=455651 RepID=UPI002614CB26|nr:photosynthetic complex putative assembly protein PuhB [uncultured Tateyamaria sp.]